MITKALVVSSSRLNERKSEEEIWIHAVLKAKRALVVLITHARFSYSLRVRKELTDIFLEEIRDDLLSNPILVYPFPALLNV